jgi:hypothetical protein
METSVVFFFCLNLTLYLLPKHDKEKIVRDVISGHESTLGVF